MSTAASARGTTPEIRRVIAHLRSHGFTVELSGGSTHWQVSDPTGAHRATLPLTPSSHRALQQARHTLRRAGLPPLDTGRHTPKRSDR